MTELKLLCPGYLMGTGGVERARLHTIEELNEAIENHKITSALAVNGTFNDRRSYCANVFFADGGGIIAHFETSDMAFDWLQSQESFPNGVKGEISKQRAAYDEYQARLKASAN